MPTLSRRLRILALIAANVLSASSAMAQTLWVGDANGKLGKVDIASGNVSLVGDMGAVMTDIAFDPAGNLYGISFTSLYRIDTTTGAGMLVGDLNTTVNSLVFGADGTLYGANNQLYTIDPGTAGTSIIGNGATFYISSGDLAFVQGELYLTSSVPNSDTLVRLDLTTGAATAVGSLGVSSVYGLASADRVSLYGVSGTDIYSVSTTSGTASFLQAFAGQGLGETYGTAFRSESAPPIPEPGTAALGTVGLLGLWMALRRRN